MYRRILRLSLVILCLLGPAQAMAAQTNAGLAMTTRAAFEGQFKFGEWLPVFVTVENDGPDVIGQIQVRVTSRTGELDFVVPAELPTGARKQFTIYTLPNSFSREIRIDLIEGDDTLLSQTVAVNALRNDRYVIGVAAANPAGMSLLGSVQLPGRADKPEVITLPLPDIPGRAEGLALFNALVLNDVDTSGLTPAQQEALQGWVAGGGRLILGGGSSAARVLAGLPAALQPVEVSGQQAVMALPGLEQYTGEAIPFSGPFPVAHVQPSAAATILSAQTAESANPDLPLIVEQKLGAGHIDFIALDLTQSPFDSWTGVIALAERVLGADAARSPNLPPDVSIHQIRDSQMSSALTNLPALDLPSIRVLGFLLAGYIVLVGPVNYVVLRWRDRLAWAWVTIPVLTLAFSALAYGIGFQLRGNDIIVNQISVIRVGEDGKTTETRTYAGIFSPRRQAYDIQVEGDPLIRPLGEGYYNPWQGEVSAGSMHVVQGEPARVQGLTVNQWSMQSFVAETPVQAAPQLSTELHVSGASLRGRLTNRSNVTLKDVIVIFYNQFQKLGDLSPGQSADLALDLTQQQPFFGGINSYTLYQFDQTGRPGPEITFKQRVLDGVLFNMPDSDLLKGVFFLAWTEDSPLEITLEGRDVSSQKTSLIYGQLPLNFDKQQVAIPPGFSQVETLSTSGDAGICTQSFAVGYSVFQGSAEAKISLPAVAQNVEPDYLALYIRTDGNWPVLPAIELYDSTREAWVPLEEASLGENPIEQPDRLYNQADASVQLRLSQENPGGGGGCLYFDLAFEGKRQ